jgi:hypothetical protein
METLEERKVVTVEPAIATLASNILIVLLHVQRGSSFLTFGISPFRDIDTLLASECRAEPVLLISYVVLTK